MRPTTAITRYELSRPFTEFDLRMNRKGFIGPSVLRPRPVAIQAADVGKIPLKELLQMKSTKRSPGSGYKRGDFEMDKYSYSTDEYGWEEPLDDRSIAIYRDIIDAEAIHADRAEDFVLQEYERDVATAVFDTAVWTGAPLTTAIVNEWDDHANATPIADVHAAKEKVVLGSGLDANALICNALQYWNLINCDEVVERVKYSAKATQEEMRRSIAELLDISMILVAGGLKNTANPQQAASIARIWDGEYAMVARVAMTEDPQEPCIGRTFIWTGDGPTSLGTDEELAVLMEEYREEGIRGSVMRARNDRDIVIMYKQAGHLLSNVLTI